MWFWIIIIAVIVGGLIAYLSGDGNAEDALSGAMAGGCLAGNCLARLAIAAISILLILWLFNVIFG